MSEILAWLLVVVLGLLYIHATSRRSYWEDEWLKEYRARRQAAVENLGKGVAPE